jgi:transcriptional regulator with XRE-family HTH domain
MSAQPNWTPRNTFAERLSLVRNHHGWNVKVAALACGVSPATWRTWERGASPHGMEEACKRISELAGVDYVWLMTGHRMPLTEAYVPTLTTAPRWPTRTELFAA